MIYSNDRSQLRRVFIEAWRKQQSGEALEPMEQMISGIVAGHPEYHRLLKDDASLEREFRVVDGQANPFLHMSMHIAIQEQISTNRPEGIREIYRSLLDSYQDPHTLEHALMECLGPCLWKAQQTGTTPNETEYLECVRRIERRPARR